MPLKLALPLTITAADSLKVKTNKPHCFYHWATTDKRVVWWHNRFDLHQVASFTPRWNAAA